MFVVLDASITSNTALRAPPIAADCANAHHPERPSDSLPSRALRGRPGIRPACSSTFGAGEIEYHVLALVLGKRDRALLAHTVPLRLDRVATGRQADENQRPRATRTEHVTAMRIANVDQGIGNVGRRRSGRRLVAARRKFELSGYCASACFIARPHPCRCLRSRTARRLAFGLAGSVSACADPHAERRVPRRRRSSVPRFLPTNSVAAAQGPPPDLREFVVPSSHSFWIHTDDDRQSSPTSTDTRASLIPAPITTSCLGIDDG